MQYRNRYEIGHIVICIITRYSREEKWRHTSGEGIKIPLVK